MPKLTEKQFLELSKVKSKKIFSSGIETLVINMECSYMDAIIHYCEENDVDFDIVPKLISSSIKEKLQAEATNLNFLPRVGTLPI
tara:strand:- start:1561 stop:1815 length:255 start_codon:yes stop_codon:yes gene_type:complete